jgi:hypothetical protein
MDLLLVGVDERQDQPVTSFSVWLYVHVGRHLRQLTITVLDQRCMLCCLSWVGGSYQYDT